MRQKKGRGLFMKIIKQISNDDIGEKRTAKVFDRFRQASRAVIFDGDRIALLFVASGSYHKLPGGGLEKDESPEQALNREAKEEIGCEIEIISELGGIIEYKEYPDTGSLKHESLGYIAKVVGERGRHDFTQTEKDLGFEPVQWFTIDEAIEALKSDHPVGYQGKFIKVRDLVFLNEAKRLLDDGPLDHVGKTIEAYEELGRGYIDSVSSADWEEVEKFAKLVNHGIILDAGCTGGRDSKKFLDRGFDVVGIDLVDSFIESAKKFAPSGEFKKMDLRDLKFKDNSFDGIWASMVLLHLKKAEAKQVIQRFKQILKSNGYLFIAVKEGTGERFVSDPLTPNHKRFFHYYSSDELDQMLEETGFEIISSRIKNDNLGRDQKLIAIIARNKK